MKEERDKGAVGKLSLAAMCSDSFAMAVLKYKILEILYVGPSLKFFVFIIKNKMCPVAVIRKQDIVHPTVKMVPIVW